MEKLLSNPENTYMAVSLSGNTDKEVLKQMASALQEEGYVKETFSDAIIQREISFPTGLPMGGINVAIPHTDPEHVNKAGFCLGILDKPVTFKVGHRGRKGRCISCVYACYQAQRRSARESSETDCNLPGSGDVKGFTV